MDSLSVIRLVSEIYSTLNIKLNIQDIYNMPSIKELSSLLEEKNSSSYQKIVIKSIKKLIHIQFLLLKEEYYIQ